MGGSRFAFIEFLHGQGVTERPAGKGPVLELASLAGEPGYRVRLPITEGEALADAAFAAHLVQETMETLCGYDVDIVLPPASVSLTYSPAGSGLSIADGVTLFPFFLGECLGKIFKKTHGSRDLSRVSVLAAIGDKKLSELTITLLAERVNYLSAVAPEGMRPSDAEWLNELSEDLLYESGLSLCVMDSGIPAYEAADVIVNLRRDAGRYEHVFREKAVYADLSQNETRLWDIARRRGDVTSFDGVKLRPLGKKDSMTLPVLELLAYVKLPAYRQLFHSGEYDPSLAGHVKNALDRWNLRITALCRLNRQTLIF